MQRLEFAIGSFVLMGILDSVLTYFGVSYLGLVEGNAFMHILIEKSWFYFFFFKIVVYSSLAWMSLKVLPRVAPQTLFGLGAGVVLYNSMLISFL